VRAVDNGDGQGWQQIPSPAPKSVVHLQPSTIETLHEGLSLVVNGGGTGARARLVGYDVAGKTGTAQVISLQGKQRAGKSDKDLRDNGWFLFFAPAKQPEVAGVVFVEHGGFGATYAAPIARHMIETYFAKKEGRPVPPFAKPGAPPTAAEANGQ